MIEKKEIKMTTTITGFEIQMHHQLIGALVKRMNVKEVELSIEEVGNITGIVIYVKDGKIIIKDGGYNDGKIGEHNV